MCFLKIVFVCHIRFSIKCKLYKIKIPVDLSTKTKFNDALYI